VLAAAPVLAAGALALSARPVGAAVGRVSPVAGLEITPRSVWGPGLRAGTIPPEPDVRFLLVHHSVNTNTYGPADVTSLLRGIHGFHTGDKGWPDIAYNFFVDRFGGVWEGRTGSLTGTVAGDATGGNQGFSQLCCFLGDHSVEPPSPEAQASMGRLLGWLARRSGIDVSPGATATFTSRGSNRHPAGRTVTVATISGHRDTSQTACPGDGAYRLVTDGTFARAAAAVAGVAAAPATAPPTTPAPTTAAPPTSATPAPEETPPTSTAEPATPPSTDPPGSAATTPTTTGDGSEEVAVATTGGDPAGLGPMTRTAVELGAAAAAGAAAVLGVHALGRRTPADEPPRD
jgi:hypothetical protein